MIPPQLLIFAAKYGKQIGIALFVLLVMFAMWLAVQYHKSVIKENGELKASMGEQALALQIAAETSKQKDEAIQKWKQSAATFQKTLGDQETVRAKAQEEARKLNKHVEHHQLEKTARVNAPAAELAANQHTLHIQCLHICATTPSGCDCQEPGPTPGEALSPVPGPGTTGPVPVDNHGTGNHAGSGSRSVLSFAGRL